MENKIEKLRGNHSKKATSQLKEIALELWGSEVTNTLFNPIDTCLCSAMNREKYCRNFYIYYDQGNN